MSDESEAEVAAAEAADGEDPDESNTAADEEPQAVDEGGETTDAESSGGADAEEDADAGDDPADAEGTEPGDAESEDEATSGLNEGDFVKLAYTIRTVDDGTLVDTTDQETAEEAGIDTEDRQFAPRTVVIGAGHVFTSVEEDLEGREVGDTGTVVVEANEAFGEYDQEQVRTVSADRIPEDDRYPGAHVDIDGQHGHVETVIGGRARVDFNHPLAGETLEYDYEVLDVVDDPIERARGLLDMYIDVDLELSIEDVEAERPIEEDDAADGEGDGDEAETETVELKTLYIESVPQLAMNQQWLFSKRQIANQLIDRLGLDQVVVREVFDGSGGGPFGGLGGVEGLEDAIEEADIDEEIDTDELVEELEAETDLDGDTVEADDEAGEE